jgi:hypothetical protein
MNPLESPTVLNELAGLGKTLRALGTRIERLAAAAQDAIAAQDSPPSVRLMPPEEHEVRALWKRLGPGNREMLYELARNFDPSESFTLEDAADALGTKARSLRGRFMNLGRSITALGSAAPHLWDADWDPDERANSYTWDTDAHRAVLRVVEG